MEFLTNAELMLLQIIKEHNEITGYEINKYVISVGYIEWADIGKTSIYTGLKKLEQKDFVRSIIAVDKTGKGPIPRKYTITTEGEITLKQEMIKAISTSREREKRFDLALSAVQILSKQETIDALDHRIEYLSSEKQRVSKDYKKQDECLPLGGKILYERILKSIDDEISSTRDILDYLNGIEN